MPSARTPGKWPYKAAKPSKSKRVVHVKQEDAPRGVQRPEDIPPPWRPTTRQTRFALASLLVLSLFAAGVWAYNSPYLTVSKVTVRGASEIPAEQIIAASGLEGESALGLDTEGARLRIAASQQIYWDEAYLIADEPPAPLRSEQLRLQSAQLRFRGFSQLLPRESDQPHWYDYTRATPTAKWPPLDGPFTRYGDVLEQMQADDDRLVIMTSGDEMTLRFALAERPLPAGWRRDYVLHSVGWDKDADINTLEGQSSLPLPFSSMQSYPPVLEQAEESERIWQLNADSLTERSAFESYWHPGAN